MENIILKENEVIIKNGKITSDGEMNFSGSIKLSEEGISNLKNLKLITLEQALIRAFNKIGLEFKNRLEIDEFLEECTEDDLFEVANNVIDKFKENKINIEFMNEFTGDWNIPKFAKDWE